MELRHDWATFNFTPELFKYVFTRLIPDVIIHSQNQDEEQVRDHYDRMYFYVLGHEKTPYNSIKYLRRRRFLWLVLGSKDGLYFWCYYGSR